MGCGEVGDGMLKLGREFDLAGSGMRLEGKEGTVLTLGTDWSQARARPSRPGPEPVHMC